MISFRKHAAESTRRPNSFLASRAGVAALLLGVVLAASAGVKAAPRLQPQQGQAAPAAEPSKSAEPSQATEPASAEESRVPIRVTRVETGDGLGVVATIGEFPSDLNEAGQEFLKREFFERFASDVLGLGEAMPGATLKVAMLPQEKENQREGDFTVGKVSGHIVVLVEKRRVLVACTFSEAESKGRLLAALPARAFVMAGS